MAQMNGFAHQGLDEDAFGPKSGLDTLKTFDAFPKTKPTYTSASQRGGQWTVALFAICFFLSISELWTWAGGSETHHFSVERGISQEIQLNMDIVVAMQCADLHINIQDASGDRILAGDLLKRNPTNWQLWEDRKNRNRRGGADYMALNEDNRNRKTAEEEDQHVGHVLGHMREGGRKFPKTPKLKRGEPANACRIYGSLEGNKVQGDWHITARGHGYAEFGGQHLDHSKFNFSHYINELSFGPHYPSLLNPLDKTAATTSDNFYKYQYYLSIVPTIFTRKRVSSTQGILDPALIPQPQTLDSGHGSPKVKPDSKTIFTNQYAATSQSRPIPGNSIPGIFFKYDIEPILLVVAEQKSSFLGLIVRLVNVVSGVMVGGGWLYQLSDWAVEVWGRRRKRQSEGVLHGRHSSTDEKYHD